MNITRIGRAEKSKKKEFKTNSPTPDIHKKIKLRKYFIRILLDFLFLPKPKKKADVIKSMTVIRDIKKNDMDVIGKVWHNILCRRSLEIKKFYLVKKITIKN